MARPATPVPRMSAARLTEAQLCYLADIGIARSLAENKPPGPAVDDPDAPDTG